MTIHLCWKILISGISVFLSFGAVTFLVNRYETPFLVTLGCFCFCMTGFMAAVISGLHILTNRHIRRIAHITRNKCCDETTRLLSENHDLEAGRSYTHTAVITNQPYEISDPLPIPQKHQPYDHPTPMPQKSYLVDEFMLMFLSLARGVSDRRVRSQTICESAIRDNCKNVSRRRRSRTWSADGDVEKQPSISEEFNYEAPSTPSNKFGETIALNIDDDELFVKTKND